MPKRSPKQCDKCGKSISYAGYSRHYKNCASNNSTSEGKIDRSETTCFQPATATAKRAEGKRSSVMPEPPSRESVWSSAEAPSIFEKKWAVTGYKLPDLNAFKRLKSCRSVVEKVEWLVGQFYKKRIYLYTQDHPIDALSRLKAKSKRDEHLLKCIFDSCGIKKYQQLLYNAAASTHGSLEIRLLKKISSQERVGISYIDFSYDMEMEHLNKMLNFDEKVSAKNGWDPTLFSSVFDPTYVAMLGLPHLLKKAFYKHEPVLVFDQSKNTKSDKEYAFYHLLPKKDQRQIDVWYSDSSLKHLIDSVLGKLNDPHASIKKEFSDIMEEAFFKMNMPDNKRDYKIWFDMCFNNYDKPALSLELFYLFEAMWICNEKNSRDEFVIFDYIREIAAAALDCALKKDFADKTQYFVHPLQAPPEEVKKKKRKVEGELIVSPLGKRTFQDVFNINFDVNQKFVWFVEYWRNMVIEKKWKTVVRFGI